jgi:hypothetical protein
VLSSNFTGFDQCIRAKRRSYGFGRVTQLTFVHEDDGRVPQSSVRSAEHEEIRKSGKRRPLVVRERAAKRICEYDVALPMNHLRHWIVRHVEAGRGNKHVELVEHAVTRSHAGWLDELNGIGHKADVVAVERRIEVVADEYALAAESIRRGQAISKGRIINLTREVFTRHRFCAAHAPGVLDESEHHELVPPVDLGANYALGEGEKREEALRSLEDGTAHVGEDPRRSSLEYLKLARHRRESGYDLDGTGTRADDSNTLARELH